LFAMVRVSGVQEDDDEPDSIWCVFCGKTYPRTDDGLSDHFIVRVTQPLQVSPRCQPDAVASWVNVILDDALAGELRLRGLRS
jgi:hypothetical protein